MEEKICPKCSRKEDLKLEYVPFGEYKSLRFTVYDYADREFIKEICSHCGYTVKKRPSDWQAVKCYRCKKTDFDYIIENDSTKFYFCSDCCIDMQEEYKIVIIPYCMMFVSDLTDLNPLNSDQFINDLYKLYGNPSK